MRAKEMAVLLLLGIFCANVRAAGVDASSQLQNLVYYPHDGQFFVSAEFYGALHDVQNVSYQGGPAYTNRTTFTGAVATLEYGIFDGLYLTVSEQVIFQMNTQSLDLYTGAAWNSGLHGLGDPTFTLAKRLHDSDDDGFYADSAVSLFPYLGRAQAAGFGQSGNDLNSGWQTIIALPLIYRLHDAGGHADEVEVNFQLTRYFGGVVSGSQAQYSTLIQPNWDGTIVFTDRYHLNSSWFLEPRLIVTTPVTFRNADQTSGAVDRTYRADAYAAPILHVGYLPKKWFLIDAYVEYLSSYTSEDNGESFSTQETTAGLELAAEF